MNPQLAQEYIEEDYERPLLPYKFYLDALEEVFDLSIVDSFLDLGCNNARLLEALNRKYRHLELLGVDYFQWSKDHADTSVRDRVQLLDLAQPQHFAKPYDIVNCSEVGEHIERAAEDVFLNNLVACTNKILILTWSNEPSHGNDQHQNPRSKNYIIQRLQQKGLYYWPEASQNLSWSLRKNLGGIGHGWWADNVMIFRRLRFLPIHSAYYIQGLNTDNVNHKKYFLKPGLYYQSLQAAFLRLAQTILALSRQRKGASILRASDGDYFFIRGIGIGSAKPGRRALTKPYDEINLPLFRRLFWQNDIITVSVEKPMHRAWKKFIFYELADQVLRKFKFKIRGHEAFKVIQHVLDPILSPLATNPGFLNIISWLYARKKGPGYWQKSQQIVDKTYMPMEAVYALLASKWLLRNFKNQIGIITGGPKLALIQKLMGYQEYRQYIETDSFTDYLEIPQIGAADNLEQLAERLGQRVAQSQAKVFLVAAGSSKIGLMPLLKAYSDAIFIDAGAGVDALAGIISQDRPYFADWVNFRLRHYDYSDVDFMDQGNPAREDKKFTTVYLD